LTQARRRRIVGLAIALVALLLGVGYQAFAGLRDRQRYFVPGQLVRIRGRFIHLDCRGEGGPTVVLESGLGGSSLDWFAVQPQLATATRVCSYDRPGLGWSQPRRGGWSSARAATDLALLLDVAGEVGPFVLVGWSAGGVVVREFAHRYPEQVAGMVLLDSSHENQQLRLPAQVVRSEESILSALRVCRLSAPLGVPRLLGVMERNASPFPFDEVRDALVANMNRSGFCGTLLREQLGFRDDVRRLDPPRPLGELPLVVVSRGLGSDPHELPPGVSPEAAGRADEGWTLLQAELADLSNDSVQLIAERSGHAIPFEQPELVVAAVRGLLVRLNP
jgi:pimeloyl-ACP methyl ester carboxylesterase